MNSGSSSRLWRVCKSTSWDFWPKLSDDPVLDYMVLEAVTLKVQREDREAQEKADKEAKVQKWKDEQKQALREQVRR